MMRLEGFVPFCFEREESRVKGKDKKIILLAAGILCAVVAAVFGGPKLYRWGKEWSFQKEYQQFFPLEVPQDIQYQYDLHNGEKLQGECTNSETVQQAIAFLNNLDLQHWERGTGMDGYMVVKGEIELIYPKSKIKLTLRDDGGSGSTGFCISVDGNLGNYNTEVDLQELMCLLEPDYRQVMEDQHLEDLREQYFDFKKLKEVIVLNADEHRAANWDKNAQVSQTLIERLQSLPLTECEPEDLGEKLPGGSTIEIEAQATDVYSPQSGKWYDSNSRTYQLFENGLSVTLQGEYTNNTVCFSCTPSVLTETLVDFVSGMDYYFWDTGQSNILWLNEQPENSIESIAVFSQGKGASQSRKTVQGLITTESPLYQLWLTLRHAKVTSVENVEAFWEEAEVECQLVLGAETYRLQLLNNALRIAPEGEEEILEYTLDERSPQRIAQATAACFGKEGELGEIAETK